MTQTSAYSVEAFIEDVRQAFSSTKDPRSQAQAIARHLTELLAVPGWAEEKLRKQAEAGGGALDLHVDEKLGHPGPDTTPGFKLMCSLSQGTVPTVNTPHDHGAGFVVYGVYQGENEHTTWRWTHPEGDHISTQLSPQTTFKLTAGQVAFFLPGEIHSVRRSVEDRTIILRIESRDLDNLWRHRYDAEASSAMAFKG
jgi:predicted metal-dependent enzyme (double-stranded beta helix superfamily)